MTDGRNWGNSNISESKKSALAALETAKNNDAKKLKEGAKFIKLNNKTYKLIKKNCNENVK